LKPDPDISVKLGHLSLKNPLVLASGVMGTSPELLHRVALSGAGAVTAKSCGPHPRAGHPNPVMVAWEHGLLNAIGLTNPGVIDEVRLLMDAKQRLVQLGVPLIASIFAGTPDEFAEVASIVEEAEPDLIEVNISCPNVHDDFGLPFAADAKSAAAVTRAVKQKINSIPIAVKLAPNVPDIGRIAQSVVDAGSDVITAVNTIPGMVIDVDAAQPVLHNRSGGLSGPALKPIAVRCVAEIAQFVDIPIIGTGGILTGRDAAEMMMAGATAVGVGSALWYRGPDAFKLIKAELQDFLRENGYKSVCEIFRKAL
jgi:dihydroorotate dehydrogenase (NAD+) catalytic subunit